MGRHYEHLTDEQVETFLTRGFVLVKNAIDKEKIDDWTQSVWTRLGYDATDKSTWEQHRIHMPTHQRMEAKEFAPRAWDAMCELVGGEERIKQPCTWGDGFIVNLGKEEDAETWQPPSPEVKGWHKDGDFFLHFLDSPEQALLTIVLWSDVLPKGGSTFVAGDSVPVIARFLAQHPEGVPPMGFDFTGLIHQCSDFFEATGEAGDIYLLHPYILHASSQNALRLPRYITNPAISLAEPMNFNRENPEDFSLVERAVLRGLGVERLDFQPTSARERIIPERERRQRQMLEEEKARLTAGLTGATA